MICANIYSLHGYIHHSMEPNLIGLKFENGDVLAVSRYDAMTFELTPVSNDDKPEYLALNRLHGTEVLEAYIPIRDAARMAAAVVKQAIGKITRLIWIAAGISAVLQFARRRGPTPRPAHIAGWHFS
jgi:hypothetical protein